MADLIDGGITTKRKGSSRDVVGDGAWNHTNGDSEGRVLLTVLVENVERVESFKTTTNEKSMDLVTGKNFSDLVEMLVRKLFLSTQERSTVHDPVGYIVPFHFLKKNFLKTFLTNYDVF